MMSDGTSFFRGMIEERVAQIHTAMPCRVESFNESDVTADVKPLFKAKYKGKESEERPIIKDVPLIKRKRKREKITTTTVDGTSDIRQATGDDEIYIDSPYLETGDIVMVVFCERALDGLNSEPIEPISARKHSLQDAVILGVL